MSCSMKSPPFFSLMLHYLMDLFATLSSMLWKIINMSPPLRIIRERDIPIRFCFSVTYKSFTINFRIWNTLSRVVLLPVHPHFLENLGSPTRFNVDLIGKEWMTFTIIFRTWGLTTYNLRMCTISSQLNSLHNSTSVKTLLLYNKNPSMYHT